VKRNRQAATPPSRQNRGFVESTNKLSWRLGGLAALALLSLSFWGVARADTPPSAWDMARDPEAHVRWTLHVRVQRLLVPPVDEDAPIPIVRDEQMELRLEAARALLEEAHADQSPDLRLRFDLGIVYRLLGDRQGRKDMYELAVRVLEPATAAMEAKGEDERAGEDLKAALESLAYAYAKLARPHEELAAWRRYIPLLLDDRVRATDMMNMGEAEMRLGHVDDAVATFREVARLCGELPNSYGVSQTYVLDLWDLAVALDRSGDPAGALENAAQAVHMNGMAIMRKDSSDGVFFVPEWERLWYLALGATVEAREDKDVTEAVRYWMNAEAQWDEYIAQAQADGKDPWLAIARVRRARTHRDLEAAKKRAGKAAVPDYPPLTKARHGT
jgi:tetratricopeptide (TPR) repeat protein